MSSSANILTRNVDYAMENSTSPIAVSIGENMRVTINSSIIRADEPVVVEAVDNRPQVALRASTPADNPGTKFKF